MRNKFSILPESDFESEYGKAFEKIDVPNDADRNRLREAIQLTQQLVVDQLKSGGK